MYARNCRYDDLIRALVKVNEYYDDNIIWNQDPVPRGSTLMFTLRVKDSKLPGARKSGSGRRTVSACWHVHGNFFDELFKIEPEAMIKSYGKTITKEHGNWEEIEVGSMMCPMLMSECCECT